MLHVSLTSPKRVFLFEAWATEDIRKRVEDWTDPQNMWNDSTHTFSDPKKRKILKPFYICVHSVSFPCPMCVSPVRSHHDENRLQEYTRSACVYLPIDQQSLGNMLENGRVYPSGSSDFRGLQSSSVCFRQLIVPLLYINPTTNTKRLTYLHSRFWTTFSCGFLGLTANAGD